MFETEVTLPRCGGKVLLRRRLSDARADGVENAYLYRLPGDAMSALMEAFGSGGLTSADPNTIMKHLARTGFEPKALLQAQKLADRDVCHLVVKRWTNVRGADDEELPEPTLEAIAALDEDDAKFLTAACYDAVREGRADPNAGREGSAPSS